MKEIGVRNLAWATPVGSGGRDKDKATVTVRQGDTLAKLAARLGGGITMEDLRRVNPQLADVDQLPVGMDLNLPTTTAGDTPKQVDEGASPTDAPSPSANWDESRLDGSVYRAFINSPAGHFGNFGAYTAAPVSGQQPDTSAEVDPRFKAVNQALQAGNATNAIAAAKELIAALQSEKPPQRDLLNHAHMALAAASLLNNDLESAGKALRTISPGTLDGDDRQRYAELRDLVKDGRREAFSRAFDADTKAGGESNQKGRAAAKEAEKLVEFIQATEPGNTKEIAEAKLKQANALLLGGNYRDAEKALKGIDEKQLDSEQKEHFTAVQDELHAQQVDALARGFDYDMKHKRYKQAVSNATAMVNNIAKHFPDRKEHLVLARLQQTTAQIMNGEMDAARQSLGRINRDDLKQMPKDAQARYRELAGALREHFENVKKLEVLKADQAVIQDKLKTIDSLTTSGDKASAQKAVSLAEQLVTTIREKYPDNADAMAGAKMTLANAKMAAGHISGA